MAEEKRSLRRRKDVDYCNSHISEPVGGAWLLRGRAAARTTQLCETRSLRSRRSEMAVPQPKKTKSSKKFEEPFNNDTLSGIERRSTRKPNPECVVFAASSKSTRINPSTQKVNKDTVPKRTRSSCDRKNFLPSSVVKIEKRVDQKSSVRKSVKKSSGEIISQKLEEESTYDIPDIKVVQTRRRKSLVENGINKRMNTHYSKMLKAADPESILEDSTIKVSNSNIFDWDINNIDIFVNKYLLLEKVDVVSHSSPTYRVMDRNGVYGDLRVFPRNEIAQANIEMQCLHKMERLKKSNMFRKVYDFRVLKTLNEGLLVYIVTYHRPGVSLKYICDKPTPIEANSGVRFGLEILEIIETLAKAKFLLTDLSPGMFRIDQYTEKLFLSDGSKIIGNFEKFAMSSRFLAPAWSGDMTYAPYTYHIKPNTPIGEADLVESVFYFILDLLGKLPWNNLTEEEMIELKKRWNTDAVESIQGCMDLPQPLITCWVTIRRGKMLDICCTHKMDSGTTILHQNRHLGLKKALVPTVAMIDYPLIYTSLRCYAGNGSTIPNLGLPACIQTTPLSEKKAALIYELMQLNLLEESLQTEIEALKRKIHNRTIHTKQLNAEVAINERFIQKFIFGDMKKKDNSDDIEEDILTYDDAAEEI